MDKPDVRAREPFNRNEYFDALADRCRIEATDIALRSYEVAAFREMPVHKWLEAQIAGILTGLVSIVYTTVPPSDREMVMAVIREYLPQAQMNVDDLMREEATRDR